MLNAIPTDNYIADVEVLVQGTGNTGEDDGLWVVCIDQFFTNHRRTYFTHPRFDDDHLLTAQLHFMKQKIIPRCRLARRCLLCICFYFRIHGPNYADYGVVPTHGVALSLRLHKT